MNENFSQIILWRQKLYGHLALARISNSPTVLTNVLAGAALTGTRQVDGKLVLVALAMILFYSAGMYLNDLFDYALDCQERPTRPLPTGLVSQREATIGAIALFGVSSILLAIVGLYAFLSGLILIALIVCYDRWHKNNPISPLLIALCRGMIYVTAFLAFSTQPILNLFFPCTLLILYIIGLTSIANTEPTTATITIRTRRGNVLTIPTSPHDNALRLPVIAHVAIIISLFLPSVYFVARPSLFTLLFALIFAAWTIYSISFFYDSPKRQIGRTLRLLIAGISLLDCIVLVVRENYQGLLLSLVAFALTLLLQRFTGTRFS